MDATDDGRERRTTAIVGVGFAVVAGLAALNLAVDLSEGTTLRHAILEAGALVIGLAGLGWAAVRGQRLIRRARSLESEAQELRERLDASRREAEAWRVEAAEAIAGLGAAIDRQLDRWGLSPAEKEIALLLLKGLSHKEIAEVRSVAEATVRQQARSLYKKAGLGGRSDLSAFFLEDLLGPRPPRA